MSDKTMIRAKKSIMNITLSAISQAVIMFLGLLLPRIILTSFGSEINGLLSSLNQVYTYMELLRAGMGMAAIQALYKPLNDDNKEEISDILSTSKNYFNKAGIVYFLGVFIIAICFTVFGNTSFSHAYVFLVAFLQGISGWVSFTFIGFFSDFLRADGKNYILLIIQTTGHIAIQLSKIIVLYLWQNIIIMQLFTIAITSIEALLFFNYRRKNYGWIQLNHNPRMSLLKNRNSYLIFHITGLICTSTDTVLISIFLGFEMASVYAVYYLVISAVNAIINTVYSSTSFLLGQTFQEGLEKFKKVHDSYYLLYVTISSALFSVCCVLCIPFIKIYTRGVNDINYIYVYLPYLFCLTQIFATSKNVGELTSNVGGCARIVVPRAIIEATINFTLTIILLQVLGIYGALIGTVVAGLYRSFDSLILTNYRVMNRSPYKSVRVLCTNIVLFSVISLLFSKISLNIRNYIDFALAGIFLTLLFISVFCFVNTVLNYNDVKLILSRAKIIIHNRHMKM